MFVYVCWFLHFSDLCVFETILDIHESILIYIISTCYHCSGVESGCVWSCFTPTTSQRFPIGIEAFWLQWPSTKFRKGSLYWKQVVNKMPPSHSGTPQKKKKKKNNNKQPTFINNRQNNTFMSFFLDPKNDCYKRWTSTASRSQVPTFRVGRSPGSQLETTHDTGGMRPTCDDRCWAIVDF